MNKRLRLSFRVLRNARELSFFEGPLWTREECLDILGFCLDKTWRLRGRVVSGVQKATFFTQLDWVQEQCKNKLGFRPYPGTLNLNMDVLKEDSLALKELRNENGIQLIPPDPNFCAANVVPVYVGGVKGAIVIPAEDVDVHDRNIIEVLAPLRLRDALGVKDGDLVTLIIDKYV